MQDDRSENGRRRVPPDQPGHRWLRLAAAAYAAAAAVVPLVATGLTVRTLVAIGYAVLVAVAAVPGGNLSAAGHTGLGLLWLLLGIAQLGVLNTSLNVLHLSVLDVVMGGFVNGLIVGTCGMYEWTTDEHGRVVRRPRSGRPTGRGVG